MLSILIPTYNTNVLPLVETIYQQCQKAAHDFEIIVADDASTDLALAQFHEKIEKFAHCKFIKNETNLGRTATRSFLAENAQYDWLLFLDADVMPKYNDFIQRFDLKAQKDTTIIFGGVAYYNTKPELGEVLRWKYGSDREAKSVKDRLKNPHFIISQNLLIKKESFYKINLVSENVYGLDNVVSYFIYKNGLMVTHMDNPVYHLGLENTETFIKKSIQSLETSLRFHQKGNFPEDFRPVQRLYLTLQKWVLLGVFKGFMKRFEKRIEKNLYSDNPNLRWFDLYRLYHYAILKDKWNA